MGPKQSNSTAVIKEKEDGISKLIKYKFLKIILILCMLQVEEDLVRQLYLKQVWKVYSKKYKRSYALKEMSKAKIIDKKSERSIRYEKELLSKMSHP